MKVKRLILREVGTYEDVALRPYVTDFDNHRIQTLAEATEGGRHLTSNNLAGLSVGMLRPSASSHGVAPIASGWNERRFSFIMEVSVRETANASIDQVITGYTDYVGASALMGRDIKLDPQMRFYFNSTFSIRKILGFTGRGKEWVTASFQAEQILTRAKPSDLSRRDGVGTMTMRPSDVIVRNSVPSEFRELANGMDMRDTRSEFSRGALKLSSRDNATSSSYLSKTLTALRNATTDDFLENDEHVRLSEARGMVRDRAVQNDPVLAELAQDSAIMVDGFVTWDEMCRMNPDIDYVTKVFTEDKRMSIHNRGDSEQWGGSDNETMAATIIANTIPTYANEMAFMDIEFECTNNTIGGRWDTRVTRLTPFVEGAGIEDNYQRFIARVEHELMPELLFNEQMMLEVSVKYSIIGDCVVNVSYDGEDYVRFTYPSFCDSVSAPVITDRVDVIDTMAHDIGEVDRLLREASDASPIRSNAFKKKVI